MKEKSCPSSQIKMKTPSSDKIEINQKKVYSISDPLQLAGIFYPQKTANLKRAAFLAIMFEIRNSPKQRCTTLDQIPDKYDLSQSCYIKVRARLRRIGLIRKMEYYWIFSSQFKNTLNKLIKIIEVYKKPTNSKHDEDFIEMAK